MGMVAISAQVSYKLSVKIYKIAYMCATYGLYIEPVRDLSCLQQVFLYVCLFDSLRPINNLSVKQGRVFLG